MGPLRHDALAAAAAWIVEVERYAAATPGLVATVGKLDIPSAAGNVIPGKVISTSMFATRRIPSAPPPSSIPRLRRNPPSRRAA